MKEMRGLVFNLIAGTSLESLGKILVDF